MKKRCLLGLLGICLVMMLTGCEALGALGAKEPTLEGKWEAELDLKDSLIEAMGEEMMEYADCFKDIVVKVNFEFTEDEVEVEFDEDSVEDLVEAIRESCIRLFDKAIEDSLVDTGMTLDEFYALLGMTREEYLDMCLEQLELDVITEDLTDDLEETFEYEVDEEEGIIKATDEDGNEEEWEYELDEDELTLIIESEDVEMEFECERK